jgi:sortase B
MFSEIYRCYDQTEYDRTLTGDLLWSTPMGGTVRLRPLCAMRQDMSYEQIQRFDFEDDGSFREWLETIIDDSTARVSGDEGLVARASRAVSVVTCSSDLPGQRDRTILVFVA